MTTRTKRSKKSKHPIVSEQTCRYLDPEEVLDHFKDLLKRNKLECGVTQHKELASRTRFSTGEKIFEVEVTQLATIHADELPDDE